MPKEEYQELEFLTTTLIELGKFYNDLENASLISGIMRGFGWRKAYGTHKEHCGIYTPSGIQNEEDYLRWKELLVRLPKVESIISKRFQKLAPGLFKKSVNKMKSAKLPSFASLEFDQASPMPFASNLTATWNEFSNESHIDNDVSPISYGGWCGITEDSGMLASRLRGFDIQHGQFFLPGISTVVDFSAVDGWTDVFWNSNLLYHQTVQSSRPANSPFTRFAFSVQITKPLFDGCQAILGKSGIKFGGFNERDARVKSLIFPSSFSLGYPSHVRLRLSPLPLLPPTKPFIPTRFFIKPHRNTCQTDHLQMTSSSATVGETQTSTTDNNKTPQSPATSELTELDEEEDSDTEKNKSSMLGAPVWPEASKNLPAGRLDDPQPSQVNSSGLPDNSEITILTAPQFLKNVKSKRQGLDDVANDIQLPWTARYHAEKALESMDDSSTRVQDGRELPEGEKVRIGKQNLLGKRNNSSSCSKATKKTRHKFTSRPKNATEENSNKSSEKTNPDPDHENNTSDSNHQSNNFDLDTQLTKNTGSSTSQTNTLSPSYQQNAKISNPTFTEPAAPLETSVVHKESTSDELSANNDPKSSNNNNQLENSTSVQNQLAPEKEVTSQENPAGELQSGPDAENDYITIKYREELAPIHTLYSKSHSMGYDGYKMALNSINELYSFRMKGFQPPTSYSNTLSSQIKFNPVKGTTLTVWLKTLRHDGPDIISPGLHEPFYKPDVWSFPLDSTSTSSSSDELGSEIMPLFKFLCHPVEAMQMKMASIIFQAVAFVAKDISSLPVYKKPIDSTDELGAELSIINYFIQCLKSPKATNKITDSTSTPSKGDDVKISITSLDKLIDNIHQMLLSFAILKARCKMHASQQVLSAYSTQWSELPEEYVSRPHYALLASFCVSGVRGLFMTPGDPRSIPAFKCFTLISIVAKVNKSLQPLNENHVLEPVWKRTNAYICSLVNEVFSLLEALLLSGLHVTI
ncbi:hypothetical protein H4Q26_003065 [Puccinia striiformis f. sp. tritici PST-130]|nr:hypothetical protein H4Q26_003065 [Puccinia striiformis f. sp. tritici PST-130]